MSSANSLPDAMHRYAVAIQVLEGMTRYLADASVVVERCADLLKSPQRISDEKDPLRGTLWFTAADLNAILAQWRICVNDAWAAWNELPGRQQANVEPPRFGMLPPGSDFFKDR
jgi:uncharacterized membrane protein